MKTHSSILGLRFLIGALGERHNNEWWDSSFTDKSSESFLSPIFMDGGRLAQMTGTFEAARRVHDEAVGVGQAFHLFRLPEKIEQALFAEARKCRLEEWGDSCLEDLKTISPHTVAAQPGPIHLGSADMLKCDSWVPLIAGHYYAAFKNGIKSFPYFSA